MNSIRDRIAANAPDWAFRVLGLVNRLLYRGERYRCPVCGLRASRFLPLPQVFRVGLDIGGRKYSIHDYETLTIDHYLCPVCRSPDRARLIALYLQRVSAQPGERGRLLHFAPEWALSRYLRTLGQYRYTTVDLNMKKVDRRADITNMAGFEDGSVDRFICSHVLEHVTDDQQAMRELHRILVPGGWGVVLAPILSSLDRTYEDRSVTTPEERLRHFGQDDHVRVYSKTDFVIRLSKAGFRVEQLGAEFFGAGLLQECGIDARSVLYVVRKSAS